MKPKNQLNIVLILLGLMMSGFTFAQVGVGYFNQTEDFVISQEGLDVDLKKMSNNHAISFTLIGLEKYRVNDSLDLGMFLNFISNKGDRKDAEVYFPYHLGHPPGRVTIYKEMLMDENMFNSGVLVVEIRDMEDKVLRKHEFNLNGNETN